MKYCLAAREMRAQKRAGGPPPTGSNLKYGRLAMVWPLPRFAYTPGNIETGWANKIGALGC